MESGEEDKHKRSAAREYVKLLENPYAELSLEDHFDEEDFLAWETKTSQAPSTRNQMLEPVVRKKSEVEDEQGRPEYKDYCNPYLKLSADGYDDEGSKLEKPPKKEAEGVSKDFFNRRAREILTPYLPAPKTRQILPDFVRDFIRDVNERDSVTRGNALKLLEKYDLTGVSGGLQLLFNREREDALKDKLQKIVKEL